MRPPTNSSDLTKAEIEYVLDWQEKRTEEQKHRAYDVLAPIGYWPHADLLESHPRYSENLEHLFFEGRTILGDQCSPSNYPASRKLNLS